MTALCCDFPGIATLEAVTAEDADGDAAFGIRAAKLFTVVKIRFTAAVIRLESAGLLMCAACSRAGKLCEVSWIRLSIFCNVSALD